MIQYLHKCTTNFKYDIKFHKGVSFRYPLFGMEPLWYADDKLQDQADYIYLIQYMSHTT